VFERFTERARRAIFFALREASGFHCPWIMTEHLLLGILREDPGVANQLSGDSEETIRKEMERAAPPNRERIPTAGDLPLSEETRQALMFATKEADALQHKNIDTPHLVLGLLRIEDCTGAKLLREYGMDYDRYRDTLRTSLAEEPMRSPPIDRAIERPAPWYEAPWVASAAESLVPSIRALENLLDSTAAHIQAYSNSYGDQRLKRKS
jgi:ATP-dependent Clp protease ATP-binding subunit ClpC